MGDCSGVDGWAGIVGAGDADALSASGEFVAVGATVNVAAGVGVAGDEPHAVSMRHNATEYLKNRMRTVARLYGTRKLVTASLDDTNRSLPTARSHLSRSQCRCPAMRCLRSQKL